VSRPEPLFPSSSAVPPTCALARLNSREAFEASRTLAEMDPWKTLGYRPEWLLEYLLREDSCLFRYGMFHEERVCGVLCVRHPWLLGPYIEILAVFPNRQGQGWGREVVRWIEDRARPTSRNLWVTVSSFNQKARDFYLRTGFTEIGVLSNLVRKGFDEVLLRKELRPAT